MYESNSKNEVIVKIVGKLSLEFEQLDHAGQLKVRSILEEVLYKYDVTAQCTAITTNNDTEEKLQIYLVCKKLDGLATKTLKSYERNLITFSSMLRKPLASIDSMDLRMFLSQRCAKLKPNSTNQQIYTLKSFFGFLSDEGYIPSDPSKKLKLTKEPVELRQPLTPEEMEIFRESAISDREKALVEFIYSSGCRLGDAVTINVSNINWLERTAVVVGKGSKQRVIYFSIKAKILMQKYLVSRKGEGDALFLTSKFPFNRLGDRSIEREIKNIAKRSGLKVNIFVHKLRHTRASDLSNSGVELSIISKILGHEQISTTMIYAKVSKENIIHEFNKAS
ncbi:tyrosine-type recombinase/integrase [Clostridium sp. DSM 17811]|nr:tyrosine-type recombinase/integrase [Clostridium sp. DSM 17811]